jgi:MFS family permease
LLDLGRESFSFSCSSSFGQSFVWIDLEVSALTPHRSTFVDASQFVYLSEIFPTQIRSAGVGLGMIGMYLASIILLVAGPIALENISWKFFLVLIIPTFFHLLNVYFFFPETKQRSLEDINAQFGEKVALRIYGATAEDEAAYAAAIAEEDLAHGVKLGDTEKTAVVHSDKL